MAIYNGQGIVAGVGDKDTGTNIIRPQFDASIRKFIVGKDCILDGMALTNNVLTAGHCLACGYIGELKTNITLSSSEKYIYGVFDTTQTNSEYDEFWIETSASQKIVTNPDLLQGKGKYYLLLYVNSERQVDNNYPENSVYCEYANELKANSIIGENVTCPTPSETDTEVVANVEFVHQQIQKQIGYNTQIMNYYMSDTADIDVGNIDPNKTGVAGTITIKKKANYAIVVFNATSGFIQRDAAPFDGYVLDTIKTELRPNKAITIILPAHFKFLGGNYATFLKGIVDTNGKITIQDWVSDNNVSLENATMELTAGWELKNT